MVLAAHVRPGAAAAILHPRGKPAEGGSRHKEEGRCEREAELEHRFKPSLKSVLLQNIFCYMN